MLLEKGGNMILTWRFEGEVRKHWGRVAEDQVRTCESPTASLK
jgi:hypothetical protein